MSHPYRPGRPERGHRRPSTHPDEAPPEMTRQRSSGGYSRRTSVPECRTAVPPFSLSKTRCHTKRHSWQGCRVEGYHVELGVGWPRGARSFRQASPRPCRARPPSADHARNRGMPTDASIGSSSDHHRLGPRFRIRHRSRFGDRGRGHISKPFRLRELVARIRSVLRRTASQWVRHHQLFRWGRAVPSPSPPDHLTSTSLAGSCREMVGRSTSLAGSSTCLVCSCPHLGDGAHA